MHELPLSALHSFVILCSCRSSRRRGAACPSRVSRKQWWRRSPCRCCRQRPGSSSPGFWLRLPPARRRYPARFASSRLPRRQRPLQCRCPFPAADRLRRGRDCRRSDDSAVYASRGRGDGRCARDVSAGPGRGRTSSASGERRHAALRKMRGLLFLPVASGFAPAVAVGVLPAATAAPPAASAEAGKGLQGGQPPSAMINGLAAVFPLVQAG